MSNQRNTVSDSVKEQIILESNDPRCVITKLASKHGVTANQIYSWRNKERAQAKSPVIQISDNFIELVADDEESLPTFIKIEYIKVELKFAEFSFSMEGKISTQKLHKIIELVSSTC
jgi:hypothetical protein